jgi:hypothetical protein
MLGMGKEPQLNALEVIAFWQWFFSKKSSQHAVPIGRKPKPSYLIILGGKKLPVSHGTLLECPHEKVFDHHITFHSFSSSINWKRWGV